MLLLVLALVQRAVARRGTGDLLSIFHVICLRVSGCARVCVRVHVRAFIAQVVVACVRIG